MDPGRWTVTICIEEEARPNRWANFPRWMPSFLKQTPHKMRAGVAKVVRQTRRMILPGSALNEQKDSNVTNTCVDDTNTCVDLACREKTWLA